MALCSKLVMPSDIPDGLLVFFQSVVMNYATVKTRSRR